MPGSFWLASSRAFRMKLSQESPDGCAAILKVSSLSRHEAYGSGANQSFSLELNSLNVRRDSGVPAGMDGIYERIWKGSLPGYISGESVDRDMFYSSYLQTYIERDVSEQVALSDKLLFQDFIRAAARRTGMSAGRYLRTMWWSKS